MATKQKLKLGGFRKIGIVQKWWLITITNSGKISFYNGGKWSATVAENLSGTCWENRNAPSSMNLYPIIPDGLGISAILSWTGNNDNNCLAFSQHVKTRWLLKPIHCTFFELEATHCSKSHWRCSAIHQNVSGRSFSLNCLGIFQKCQGTSNSNSEQGFEQLLKVLLKLKSTLKRIARANWLIENALIMITCIA